MKKSNQKVAPSEAKRTKSSKQPIPPLSVDPHDDPGAKIKPTTTAQTGPSNFFDDDSRDDPYANELIKLAAKNKARRRRRTALTAFSLVALVAAGYLVVASGILSPSTDRRSSPVSSDRTNSATLPNTRVTGYSRQTSQANANTDEPQHYRVIVPPGTNEFAGRSNGPMAAPVITVDESGPAPKVPDRVVLDAAPNEVPDMDTTAVDDSKLDALIGQTQTQSDRPQGLAASSDSASSDSDDAAELTDIELDSMLSDLRTALKNKTTSEAKDTSTEVLGEDNTVVQPQAAASSDFATQGDEVAKEIIPSIEDEGAELTAAVQESTELSVAEQIEQALAQAELSAQEKIAQAREEAQRLADEKVAAAVEQAERAASERVAAVRAELEEKVKISVDEARAEAEKLANERIEAAKLAAQQDVEVQREAMELEAAEKLEAVRAQVESDALVRIAQVQAEDETRLEAQLAAARAEIEQEAREQVAAAQAAGEKLAEESAAKAREEAERQIQEQAAARAEGERQATEQEEATRAEIEQLAADKANEARQEAEQEAAARAQQIKAEAEALVAEQVSAVRAEAEKLTAERIAAVREEAQRELELRTAEAERLAAERVEAASANVERLAQAMQEAEQLAAQREQTLLDEAKQLREQLQAETEQLNAQQSVQATEKVARLTEQANARVAELEKENAEAKAQAQRLMAKLEEQTERAELEQQQAQVDQRAANQAASVDETLRPTNPLERLDLLLDDSVTSPTQKLTAVTQYLSEAQEYFDAFALTRPSGANALQSYQAVLAIDADNADAQAGIDNIVVTYERWAERAVNRGQTATAITYYERAQEARPDSEEIALKLLALQNSQNTAQQGEDFGTAGVAGPVTLAAPDAIGTSADSISGARVPPQDAGGTTDFTTKQRQAREQISSAGLARTTAEFVDFVRQGDVKMAALFLDAGFAPDSRDGSNGFTPLLASSMRGDLGMVELLVGRGADPNLSSFDGRTALMAAAWEGHADIVDALVARGVDVNAGSRDGWTAMHYAAWKGHTIVVARLLAAGADPNRRNAEGWNAPETAQLQGHDDLAELLLRNSQSG